MSKGVELHPRHFNDVKRFFFMKRKKKAFCDSKEHKCILLKH